MPARAGAWLRRFARRVPGVAPGSRSLHRHLLLWLLLPQLVLWLAAAWVTYNLAARYATQALDRSLYQTSRALARQVKPIGNGLLIDFPRAAQDIIESDSDERVFYMVSTPPGQFILGNDKLPAPPPELGDGLNEPRFYDGRVGDVPVRVAALYLAYGEDEPAQRMLVQVARGRTSREALLRSILVDTALPLSVLVALMSLIVWAGIRAGLAPLDRLRDAVQDRAPNDLAPIALERAPQEVRGLAGAVNALLNAVHESVSSQRRFINDAAHQLRTPLAGLKSQTELALADLADPERLRDPQAVLALQERLARVQQSAARSAHLVNQLLTLARAEPESAAVMGRNRFDLAQLGRDLAAEWVPRALAAGVDLGFDGPPTGEPLPVEGSSLLVREALANLIDNAVRYAGRGAEVTLRVRREDALAVAEVEDNGPGIPDALDRERMFGRFVRGSHDGSGCGLGLSIVKEIVERHAGTVQLEPAAPHGLRVRIELPRAGAALERFRPDPPG
ncbi:sensor histidine kinase [Caldimonas sp. KR1-144]|uniref:sensor histidine kinase n=1 Tax=Caldimonas sp. KR1-144 TaxID=3400911 RepID=UPI003C0B93D9